jgi:hypothetical protein
MICVFNALVSCFKEGEVLYGLPGDLKRMSPRDAITEIFRAYGWEKKPEFCTRKTDNGRLVLQMLEFFNSGSARMVSFSGTAGEMEVLYRAAEQLATAKPGDRSRIAMMLREGITLSVDINRGLELTISELGLALQSYLRTDRSWEQAVKAAAHCRQR